MQTPTPQRSDKFPQSHSPTNWNFSVRIDHVANFDPAELKRKKNNYNSLLRYNKS
jgi:hypothetical protein